MLRETDKTLYLFLFTRITLSFIYRVRAARTGIDKVARTHWCAAPRTVTAASTRPRVGARGMTVTVPYAVYRPRLLEALRRSAHADIHRKVTRLSVFFT